MFEAAELGRKVSKDDFKQRIPQLRTALLEAQRAVSKTNTSVMIIIAGVEGAGKGEVVNRLNEWLDTRGLQTWAFWDETDEEKQRPRWWRFWRSMPARGEIGIFFGSWYTHPILSRVNEQCDDADLGAELSRITDVERMLVQDDALIIKFWFHLSKDEQHKRLKKLKKDPHSRWRMMRPETGSFAKRYEGFKQVSEKVIRETDTGFAPWYLIEANDPRYRDLTVGKTILNAINQHLHKSTQANIEEASHSPALPDIDEATVTVLDHVDLSQRMEKDDYKKRIKTLQTRLNDLIWDAYRNNRSTVLVFEGWDAGGKGGAIRRITQAIDARLYRVVPIAAPSDEEAAHHYLWRFWRHIPRAGRLTVFDRSWYGRVLVERVEGFAQPQEWQRAFHEINEFEEQLAMQDATILKFWLHISPEEQLRRFKEREQTPYKAHKITAEDWRNRDKWDDYKSAVNEMIFRTSNNYAPWHLVPGDDKKYARVFVLEKLCAALEKKQQPATSEKTK